MPSATKISEQNKKIVKVMFVILLVPSIFTAIAFAASLLVFETGRIESIPSPSIMAIGQPTVETLSNEFTIRVTCDSGKIDVSQTQDATAYLVCVK